MQAVVCRGSGGPEVMVIAEVEDARPSAPDEVLIEVTAAGVNRADLLQRQGFYPPPPGASPILGLECSGTVGGDDVCALLTGGGYAQRVAVPAGQVMPLPPGIGPVAAAGLPEVAATVYSNLHLEAQLQPGEWLLVHGGGSGIGTFAIQWAKAIGARVVVTAGSDAKRERCRQLGAEAAIDYRGEDWPAQVRAATQGHGADVILDIVGARYLDGNVACLAVGGRIVVIGLQGGTRGELDLAALLMRRGTLMATSLRARPTEQKAAICAGLVADVWPLLGSGRILPVIDQVLPLDQVRLAHEQLAAGSVTGKLVLQVGPSSDR
ncbi:MAG: NAD(P)H-quinone oxidoreductase [Actinobacteria bacterium]|nr:MAG: NAD(P)H-quinone oxidoreductase [Actinomycetota bacterium]